MQRIPRTVVVDNSADLAGIVRAALTLLSRPHILVSVPSSDDALQELASTPADLVVTAYQIPGQMNGAELAECIVREALRTPVIVLAAEHDPLVDVATQSAAEYQFFVRPVGEPFLRGLRVALDGADPAEAEEAWVESETRLGLVPTINVEAMRGIISSLARDVGALGVIVADRTGRILIDQGATGSIDRERLARILGPSFARAADISEVIGGNAWTMHYYDGERVDVFGLGLGVHYFACLIFDGGHRGAFGAVRMFGRRAADQLIAMLGPTAYRVAASNGSPLARQVDEERRTSARPAAPTVTEDNASTPARVEPSSSERDFEALFGQPIDELQAALLFDPDALTEFVESLPAEGEDRLDFDGAVGMGLLDSER